MSTSRTPSHTPIGGDKVTLTKTGTPEERRVGVGAFFSSNDSGGSLVLIIVESRVLYISQGDEDVDAKVDYDIANAQGGAGIETLPRLYGPKPPGANAVPTERIIDVGPGKYLSLYDPDDDCTTEIIYLT